MYRDVVSMVKISLSWPEKLKSRKIFSACVLSLMYDGKDFAELVLTLNCFSFAGNYYKQINGVAMGTRMGPSYANLFVGYVEHQFFNQYNGPKPELYGRYIDDCIDAISSSREELDQFITSVNSFHPALKYTWEMSETSLAFLDIKVSIGGNVLCTSVHYQPTDSHSYLLYSLSHPSHVKNSIPYSQFLRLRICDPTPSARLIVLCKPALNFLKLVFKRQCGPLVRALALRSGNPGFKTHSDQ